MPPQPVPEPFRCPLTTIGGQVSVTPRGELDLASTPQLDDALRRAQEQVDLIVLDLSELEFMDSSGAQLLLASKRRIHQTGGQLVLQHPSEEITWLLALIGVDRELGIAGPAPHPLPSVGAAPNPQPGDSLGPGAAMAGRSAALTS